MTKSKHGTWGFWLFVCLFVAGCGPTSSGGGTNNTNDDSGAPLCTEDEDGDTICDQYEGRSQGVDTDGDGTPDYLDLDSDGDGIADSVEGGTGLGLPPRDADGDGTPDFRDLDSDNNGIPDEIEGPGDADLDSIPNFADLDDDDDGILDVGELGPDPMNPLDTDGDGTPDFRDPDSDNDTISDRHETGIDTDEDGIPDFRDLDTDNDGIPDEIEAGDADINTFPVDSDNDGTADFRDTDSDNDGLSDNHEYLGPDGIAGTGDETDWRNEDTDGDGVSDLIEVGAGTNPQDPQDNPQANGDFVFVVPYQEPADPTEDTLDFATDLVRADLYFLADVSGSMEPVMANIKTNMQTTIAQAMQQIPDLQVGIGSFLYAECGNVSGAEYKVYHHRLDIQADPVTAQNTFPSFSAAYENYTAHCCAEPPRSAIYCAATGHGTAEAAAAGVTIPNGVPNEVDCNDQPGPCPAGHAGYPCFRPGSLPIVAVVTDEGFDQYTGTTQQDAIDALATIGAKVIGIYGVGSWGDAGRLAMEAFCTAQGSVDANNQPLVYDGSSGNASQSIIQAITALSQVPMDISSFATDNDDGTDQFGQTDTIDSVVEFIDHLEATDQGAVCTSGWQMVDGTDPDNYVDTFLQVDPGNRVCWDIFVKDNTTVPATEHPQVFTATIHVYGDGVTEVDSRVVYFLVPPIIEGPIPR